MTAFPHTPIPPSRWLSSLASRWLTAVVMRTATLKWVRSSGVWLGPCTLIVQWKWHVSVGITSLRPVSQDQDQSLVIVNQLFLNAMDWLCPSMNHKMHKPCVKGGYCILLPSQTCCMIFVAQFEWICPPFCCFIQHYEQNKCCFAAACVKWGLGFGVFTGDRRSPEGDGREDPPGRAEAAQDHWWWWRWRWKNIWWATPKCRHNAPLPPSPLAKEENNIIIIIIIVPWPSSGESSWRARVT